MKARTLPYKILTAIFPAIDEERRRNKWVMSELARIPPGKRLLDVGAGEQPYRGACAHLVYTSQDTGKYAGSGDKGLHTGTWATNGLSWQCDAEDMKPIASHSYDVVLCTEVLEHVPHPERVLREISRVLKHDGTLIMTAPFASQTHFAPEHYCTGFNRYWYETVLPEKGLRVEEVTLSGNYYSFLAGEMARLPSTTLRYVGVLAMIVTVPVSLLGLVFFRVLEWGDQGSKDQLCTGVFVRARKGVDD